MLMCGKTPHTSQQNQLGNILYSERTKEPPPPPPLQKKTRANKKEKKKKKKDRESYLVKSGTRHIYMRPRIVSSTHHQTTVVMTSALLLLVLLATQTVVSEELTPAHTVSQSPSLTHRLARLEGVVLEQKAKISQQDSLLRQQAREMARAKNDLHLLKAKVSDQDDLIGQLRVQLSDQDTVTGQLKSEVRKQNAVLRHQDGRLSDQDSVIGQLKVKLSDQDSVIDQLKVKLSDQDSVVGQLNAEVRKQNDVIRHQDGRLSEQDRLLRQQDTIIWGLQSHHVQSVSPQTPRHVTEGQRSEDHMMDDSRQRPSTMALSEHDSSAKRDVLPRADDANPLEAVVTGISRQVTEMSADIQALRNSDVQHTQDIRDAATSTFVRWGSSTCDASSELVYSGVVGGSYYTHTGGATNFLCLTMSPVFGNHTVPSGVALLYGGEYQTFDSHEHQDPVCAVCRSSFPTTVMVPGTNVCSPGWRVLYSGYLMAGPYTAAGATEYVCVDPSFEATIRSSVDQNGHLMYLTVTRCGSLPCPPYVNNQIVTCAVCGK